MGEIVGITTSETAYNQPDSNKLRQSVKNISRLVFFKTEYYESLREKAKSVETSSNSVDLLLIDKIPYLLTTVRNLNLSSYFKTLAEIDAALATDLDPGTAAALAGERAKIEAGISDQLNIAIAKFNDASTAVERVVREMVDVVIYERAQPALEDETQKNEVQQAQLESAKSRKAGFQEEQQAIIAAQDVIRDNNLVDQFSEFIPSDEELAKLDLKEPEVTAIQLGVSYARKEMDMYSEALKYADLADSRTALDKKIDEVEADIVDINERLAISSDVISDIVKVLEVDTERSFITPEVNKIIYAWKDFGILFSSISGAQINETNINMIIDKQEKFNSDLSNDFLNVILV